MGPGYAEFPQPWHRVKLIPKEKLIRTGTSDAYLATVRCFCASVGSSIMARISLRCGALSHVSIMPRDPTLFHTRAIRIDSVMLHAARSTDPPYPITGRRPLRALPAADTPAAEWMRHWHARGQLHGLQAPPGSGESDFDAADLGISFPGPYVELMACSSGFVFANALVNDPWHAEERLTASGIAVRLAIRADRTLLELDEAREQLLIGGEPVASCREQRFEDFAAVLEGFAINLKEDTN